MFKKYFNLLIVIIIALTFSACEEDTTGPPPESPKGSIFIQSTPDGAQIWINNSNTNKVTPDTVTNLNTGIDTVTLKLSGFSDTSFIVTIIANTTISKSIDFIPTFGPVRIWETTGTTVEQPSGLDLSAGVAYGISSIDKDKVDIFYSSSGFIVTSAHVGSGMTRQTFFKIGAVTNLNDGIDSPVKDGTWAINILDTETKYVFLYDNDFHYSKMKIVNRGGGVPGTPAWVEIEWIYNKVVNDRRF